MHCQGARRWCKTSYKARPGAILIYASWIYSCRYSSSLGFKYLNVSKSVHRCSALSGWVMIMWGRERDTDKMNLKREVQYTDGIKKWQKKGETEDAGVEVKKSGEERKEIGGEKRKDLNMMKRYMLYSLVGEKKIKWRKQSKGNRKDPGIRAT